MTICTVSGSLTDVSMGQATNVELTFRPSPFQVLRNESDAVIPTPIKVSADGNGDFTVDLAPASYEVDVRDIFPNGKSSTFTVFITVPDASLANFEQILNVPSPKSADAIETAVSDARAARDNANLSADLAEDWAEEDEDTEVTPGSYSALHHAAKAGASSTAAANAQTAAETAQTAAETAETGAETARAGAEAAETGAQAAQTAAETAQTGAETARTGAETAETDAETARDKAQDWAETPEDTEVETGAYSALHHAAKSEASATAAAGHEGNAAASASAAAASSSLAQDWAESDTAPGGAGTQSAKTWADEAQVSAQEAAAGGPSFSAQIGTVASVLGQVSGQLDKVSAAQDGGQSLIALATMIGQLVQQVNGGQTALRGGTLDDPALRIGTVGIYSVAADTLSVAIAGTEVARLDASGLTIYGTLTEAT